MFNGDYVQVQRYVAATTPTSLTGQKNLILTTVATYECDIQMDRSVFITPPEGQTVRIWRRMFLDADQTTGVLPDIREKDIVTDLNRNEKYKVYEVFRGKLLPHIEVGMNSPI
jgi:hypothetical protein